MKTIVYIDALNLYYGVLKRTPYKRLDLAALCSNLLSDKVFPFIHEHQLLFAQLPEQVGAFYRPQTW